MTYTLDGSNLLFAIDRTQILDISVRDVITIDGLDGVAYEWTDHDRDFLENNPDADLFLEVERYNTNHFRATGIILK